MKEKPMKLRLAFACTLLLAGCASVPPQMSRDEALSNSSRQYVDVTPESAFEAAKKVFTLSDKPSDLQISYPDHESMVAVRWTAPFPVHIWYHWTIKAVPAVHGTRVSASISTTAHGLAVPGGLTPYTSPSVLNLFYERLDYLLGISELWPTCATFQKANPDSSSLDALCKLAEDNAPQAPLPKS